MRTHKAVLGAAIGTLLAGCASIPTGPTVAVMPGPGKPFEQFRQDDAVCREFARQQLGVEPSKVAQQQVLSGAVAGAAIGAGPLGLEAAQSLLDPLLQALATRILGRVEAAVGEYEWSHAEQVLLSYLAV